MIAKAAALAAWYAVTRYTETWGALPNEVETPIAGDELITRPALVATRAIEIPSPPDRVFPWLVQMGPGRAGWYSYDWIDNRGTPSATSIHPEWQDVQRGDSLGSIGGIEFEVAERRDPELLVIRLPPASPIAFTMAYLLRPWAGATRLVTRVRADGPRPVRPLLRYLLGPGDFVMLRRQLVGLRARAGDPLPGQTTMRQ